MMKLRENQQIHPEKELKRKPAILIGSLSKGSYGAIPTITQAFIDGLQSKYKMIPHYANRRYGLTSHAGLNFINIYYFLKHLFLWVGRLAFYRPEIAHYPITSYMNLEKALTFLKIAKIFRSKTVGHLHGGAFTDFWESLSERRKAFAVRELNRIEILIVLSKQWKQWVCENIGLSEDKVMVVNNPIEKGFERNALSLEEPEIPGVFFLGSLGKRKGVYDILNVAEQLKKKNIQCTISLAGPEDRKGDLKKITETIAVNKLENVKILKPVYGKTKIDYFEKNSIFLFPSYNENFPLVIIEAAAAGKTIITTKVGALPEFFQHNQSLLFIEPGNIEQITNALTETLIDRNKRHALGTGARTVFINKLSRDVIIKSLDKVYQTILSSKA